MLKATSLFLASLIFFYVNGHAVSSNRTQAICAELRILEKTSSSCEGSAIFKEKNGKYTLQVKFKVADFEDENTKQKNQTVSKNKELIFLSPEFTEKEWKEKLKGAFNLVTADLLIQDGMVELSDTTILKKQGQGQELYQVDSIIPMNKARFLKIPKSLKGAKIFHLTLVVPLSEIKSVTF